MNKPRWLDDEEEIQGLLHWFIDRLDNKKQDDRKNALNRSVNHKNFPALFRHDELSDHEWTMLTSLSKDYELFEIKQNRKPKPHEAVFANKSLVFNQQAEQVLRQWLERPAQLPYPQQWRTAVTKYASHFSDQGEALASRAIKSDHKNADDIVAGFAELAPLIDKGLSLRQLSARCFWGHSKFLDSREELITELFKNSNIRPRPIMVNVCLPENIEAVLFIENQDSYVSVVNKLIPEAIEMNHLALVYLSGFQGSAKRIRDRQGISLHFHSTSKRDEKSQFEHWWFENDQSNWQTFFWGDLDFAGMSILKTLRQRFSHTEAWRPGYDIMLAQINSGQGHDAVLAGKQEQHDPEQTGCAYADSILLPALRKTARFIDQESV